LSSPLPTPASNSSNSNNSSNVQKKGDGITQGGIILMENSTGTPLAMYQEETGAALPLVDLVVAMRAIRHRQLTKQEQQQQERSQMQQSLPTIS
jgi:hypothetical protein